MNTAKARLEHIISTLQISYNQLGKKIGLNRSQALYDIRDGKIKNISLQLATLIKNKFPSYSIEWLMEGVGEKYEEGFVFGENPNITRERSYGYEKSPEDKDKIIELLENSLAEKDKRIADKDQMIELLKEQLKSKTQDKSPKNTDAPAGSVQR